MFIYIIKNGKNYKIGQSKCVKNRLTQLQTSHSEKLEIIETYSTNYPNIDEKYLHEIFKLKHIRGEWYQLDFNDLKKIADYFKDSCKRIKMPDNEIRRLNNLKNASYLSDDDFLSIYIKNMATKDNREHCKDQKEKDFMNKRANFYREHYKLLSENHLEALIEILFTELSKRRIKNQLTNLEKEGKFFGKIHESFFKTLILLDDRLQILKKRFSTV